MREQKFNQNLVMATHVSDDTHKEGDKDLQGEDAAQSANDNSRFSVLLACRELTPMIMEHEKAIIVMKEHDYAGVPELTRMAPLLHSLTTSGTLQQEDPLLTTTTSSSHDSSPNVKSSFSRSTAKTLLLNVRNALADNRREVLTGGTNGLMSHFKEMISLQSILLHELQEQIQIKDIESNTAHREKEQLKARLERMERRMSILQKHSKDKTETNQCDESSPSLMDDISSPLRPDSITRLTRSDGFSSSTPIGTGRGRKSRSRSSSTDISTSRRVSKQSITGTPPFNSLEVSHKAIFKRDLEDGDDENETSSSKRHRSSSSTSEHTKTDNLLRTPISYNGLSLSISLPSPVVVNNNTNSTSSGKHNNDRVGGEKAEQSQATPTIKVPTWRECSFITKENEKDLNCQIIVEDTSDEVYNKRHLKLETDEKRRKRWDAQRMREQFQHSQLMKRYMMKEGIPQTHEKKKEKLTTFLPKLENLEGIELNDTVVVSSFGRPLPKLPPNPFRLANFNPHTAASKGSRGKVSKSRHNSSTSNSISEGTSHVT